MTRDKFFDKQLVDGVMKKTKGVYPAPLAIAELLRESSKVGFGSQKAYDAEAAAFGKLTMKTETKD